MRPNNFDLLRLMAAISVLFFHTRARLDIDLNHYVVSFFGYIPGVPIFFFISGFLISLSYKKSSSVQNYMRNRILRIYPALYLCLLLSVGFIIYIGYLDTSILGTQKFWVWILAQISFVQFYNPEFLRGYGTGVLNGSLWTISVELQFYFLVPFLYKYLINRYDKNKVLIILLMLFSIINIAYNTLGNSTDFRTQATLYKLLYVSFLPWFYMFLLGIFFQENFYKFRILYEMPIIIKSIYIITILSLYNYFSLNPITFFLFGTVLYIVIFSFKNVSDILLRGNDYSYGIYIYHAVAINYFIYSGYTKEPKYLIYILLVSLVLAFFSWHLLEKPMLKLKKRSRS